MKARELIIPLLLLAIVFLYILTGVYLSKWEVLPMVSCKKGYPKEEPASTVTISADSDSVYWEIKLSGDMPGEYVAIDSLGIMRIVVVGK